MALFKRKKEKNRKPTRLEQRVKELIESYEGTLFPSFIEYKVERELSEDFNYIAYNILLPISILLVGVGFPLILVKWTIVGAAMLFIGFIMPLAAIQIKYDYVKKGMEIYNQIINKKGATHGN